MDFICRKDKMALSEFLLLLFSCFSLTWMNKKKVRMMRVRKTHADMYLKCICEGLVCLHRQVNKKLRPLLAVSSNKVGQAKLSWQAEHWPLAIVVLATRTRVRFEYNALWLSSEFTNPWVLSGTDSEASEPSWMKRLTECYMLSAWVHARSQN